MLHKHIICFTPRSFRGIGWKNDMEKLEQKKRGGGKSAQNKTHARGAGHYTSIVKKNYQALTMEGVTDLPKKIRLLPSRGNKNEVQSNIIYFNFNRPQ